jgi:hypothetical protein
MWRAFLAVFAISCGAHVDDSGGDGLTVDAPSALPPDASAIAPGGGSGSGSGSGSGTTPACSSRVVYLNFGGVTLTHGATDSTTNSAAWIGVTTATVPAYGATANIASITSGVQSALSQFPVTVVTQRPTSGQYVMIAFGGTKTAVGTGYGYATGDHDCGDLVKNDVGWVSDTVPANIVVPVTVGTIGWALGLQGTTDTSDCMCGWANNCQWSGTTCTLHAQIATTSSNSPATTCAGLATQDETAAFHTAFCQ